MVVLPLLACVVCAATALAVWLRAPDSRLNRPIVGVGLAGAWWAFCEANWNLAPDADAALFWLRLSAPGWLLLGPLALHFMTFAAEREAPRLQRLLPYLYAQAVLATAIAWATPWLVASAEPAWYGWAGNPGPLLVFQFGVIAASASVGLAVWRGGLRRPNADHHSRNVWITLAYGTPLLVVTITDVVLPLLRLHWIPRLGTTSLAVAGVVHVVSMFRHGDSLLAPDAFASRMLQAIPDGVASLGMGGTVRAANTRFAELIGVPQDRLRGRSLEEHFSLPIFEKVEDAREIECDLIPVSGPPVAVAVSTAVARDARGTPRGIALIVRDLREVAALRSHLLVSGRMAAVGELAAGIAHEINNPLTYVRANLSMLRESWRGLAKAVPRGDEAARELVADGEAAIDESLEGVARASAIVRDVRHFSHAGGTSRIPTDLNDLARQTLRVAKVRLPVGARLEIELEDLPMVPCEPQQMKQVLMNLVLNAVQAIGSSGLIRVSTRRRGTQASIVVHDDGPGIPAEVRERIFDPFFTTKPVGEGTGLGLSIAFGIVRRHGGSLEVRSDPGEGSSFEVRLPLEPFATG